jgi:hypothetical protein
MQLPASTSAHLLAVIPKPLVADAVPMLQNPDTCIHKPFLEDPTGACMQANHAQSAYACKHISPAKYAE